MTRLGAARRRATRVVAVVATSCGVSAWAQIAAPPDGTPSAKPDAALSQSSQGVPAMAPWRADVVYKLDLLHARKPRLATGVGYLDAALNVDADALLGWPSTTLRLEAISDQGGRPNARVGTIGGLSNLEVAERSARLYAAWLATDVAPGWNLLAGLYDLNSEFYSTDASSLLIHPSFGIGTDFSQSGRNGPSIFPSLSFGVRLRVQGGDGRYAQAAVLDGVPGDPDHPGRTVVRLSRSDGALVVGEGGRQNAAAGGHWGFGLWAYTQPQARLDGSGAKRTRGAYALWQQVIVAGPQTRTTAFVRAGVADGAVNAVALAADAGLLVEQPFGTAGPAALSVGVTTARFGSERRRIGLGTGDSIAPAETAVEMSLRWRIARRWAVQPLLQHVFNAGGRRGANTSIVGARIEGAIFSSAP